MDSVLPIAIVPASQALVRAPAKESSGFFAHIADHFIPHARNNYHPHIFGHRLTGLLSMMLISLKIFTIALVSFGPVLPAYSSAITSANIISLTNQSRAGYGLAALTENSQLAQAAQTKADDMLAKGYFSHTTPDGKTPWDFIAASGYNYITAGENLAVNFTEAENVEDAWMNSPGHKANIVNKNFTEIGIGISEGQYQGHEAIFVVQMFGTPEESKVALSDEPTVVQTQAVPVPAPNPAPAKAIVPAKVETAAPAASLAPVQEKQVAVVPAEEMKITDTRVTVEGQSLLVQATLVGDPVRVLATYGKAAVELSPKSGNIWTGSLNLSTLSQQDSTVYIKAYDLSGSAKVAQVAEFSSSTQANYQPKSVGSVAGAQVSFAGKIFNPNVFQQKFYLLFITVMLVSLVVAIGVKRHIQHLSLVANGSFVVILATLLWMAG